MTDIVERLRLAVMNGDELPERDAIEAADEIERLRALLRDRPRDDGTVVYCSPGYRTASTSGKRSTARQNPRPAPPARPLPPGKFHVEPPQPSKIWNRTLRPSWARLGPAGRG
jgi:hypothetical protein